MDLSNKKLIKNYIQPCEISIAICVHNEEEQLTQCLEKLIFADEIVVLLDKCSDQSKNIAKKFTNNIIEGNWSIEGDRRNEAIKACNGKWIFEIDADERVPEALAREIKDTVSSSNADWHGIPVDNYIGERLVRYGWGAYFGKSQYPGLFKKGAKTWGRQRVHPELTFNGPQGKTLTHRINHYVDKNISDMIKRLDSYTSAKAKDIRENGGGGSFNHNLRRIISRFWKCYVLRKGYREGKYGFLIALFAGLYPILSYLKAKLEKE